MHPRFLRAHDHAAVPVHDVRVLHIAGPRAVAEDEIAVLADERAQARALGIREIFDVTEVTFVAVCLRWQLEARLRPRLPVIEAGQVLADVLPV